MKKLFLALGLAAMGFTASAQAISDMAVIPIGVTLNSIARLTVTNGGNIEFVVNTMDQYDNGVEHSPATTTTFSVSCSHPFGVTLGADNSNLYGTINNTNTMPIGAIEYTLTQTEGSGTKAATMVTADHKQLTETPVYIMGGENAGHDAGKYEGMKIQWSLSTQKKIDLHNYASDRYVVNAFLQLKSETKAATGGTTTP